MEPFKIIELFSGIGSQTQALKNIGIDHQVVCVCELDKYAHKSYEAVHGETLNLGDITKVEHLPDADLWAYSFPCTDLSLAGKQKGMERGSGTRSGLLWEVERLLKTSKLPKYLLMENVKPLVGEKFLSQFNEWQSFLWELGYKNYWEVLNATGFGIPQNRERVFMVSILGDSEGYSFPEPEKLQKTIADIAVENVDEKFFLSNKALNTLKNHAQRHNEKGNGFATIPKTLNDISGTILARYAKDGKECLIKYDDGKIRRLTPLECWRLMGFDDSSFFRAEMVNSNSQLYKQAGNSIVVQVLEGIFKSLFNPEESNIECIQQSLF